MAGKQKILTVGDDENIAGFVSLYLEKECFETHIAPDGAATLSLSHSLPPDLALLGLILPHVDSYQVRREIRKSARTPAIVLSAKGEVFDRVLGFELDASDYIVKSFEPKELVVRVRAVLRYYRSQGAVPSVRAGMDIVRCEDLETSLTNYAIRHEGRPVEMPLEGLELLYFTASHPSQVFTREQLPDHAWGYEYVGDTRTVDAHIKRLHEKLKDKSSWSVATVRGVGYRLSLRA